jgi:D-alanyl-D-alanine carboxypeptidase
MKTGTTSFLLATLLLFFIFTNRPGKETESEEYTNLDNKISLASLTVVTPPYIALTELSTTNDLGKYEKINAESFLVSVIGEAIPIYSFKNDIRWPIASITKLLTAIVATENLGLDKTIEINLEDILVEGNNFNLQPGEKFSVQNLITAMLTVSSNDAAYAIARTYGYNNFIQAMNNKAFAIGMRSSFFSDSTGLSALNQSTVEDLEKLANYISERYPVFLDISRGKDNFIVEINTGKSHELVNINKFAGDADFVGGKTGYTEEARGNLVSVFNWKNKKVLIIVLGSEDRFLETSKLYNRAKNVLK